MIRRLVPLALVVVLSAAVPAAAQDRLPPIAPDKMTPAQKKAVEDYKEARGVEMTGPFIPMLRSPEVMTRARAMGDYLRFKSVLPPRLSEFIILLTAREWTQRFEWGTHSQVAIQAGVASDTVTAIAQGRRPEHLTDDEDILYGLVEELNRNHSVSDVTYRRVVARFGEQGVIDTVGLVGYYTLLAMVLNTAQTPATEAPIPLLALPR